jgi:hypothetical protein
MSAAPTVVVVTIDPLKATLQLRASGVLVTTARWQRVHERHLLVTVGVDCSLELIDEP